MQKHSALRLAFNSVSVKRAICSSGLLTLSKSCVLLVHVFLQEVSSVGKKMFSQREPGVATAAACTLTGGLWKQPHWASRKRSRGDRGRGHLTRMQGAAPYWLGLGMLFALLHYQSCREGFSLA